MRTKIPVSGPCRRAPCAGLALIALALLPSPARAEPAPLTLSQATETALSGRPELAAWASDLEAVEGRVLQASLKPNPELEFETTNGIDEATVSLSQVFELGKKRETRIRRAEAEGPVLQAERERQRLDVAAEVSRAFVALLGAQERLRLTHEGYELASELASTAAERVAAGAVSPIEETRARVALAAVAGDLERARGEVEAARVSLAASMGSPAPNFGPAAGPLGEDLTVPDRATFEDALGSTPDVTRWQHEAALRQAAVEAEEGAASSDVTFKGGLGYARDPGEALVLLSVSIPLAVRDKNQGAIREARASVARVAHERRAEEARLRSELLRSHASLTAFAREATTLRDQGLASAQQAYDAVNEGYRQGKFRYLDVLDAGNALLEVRLRYVDAVTSFELARVDLNRLTARGTAPAQKEN